MKLEWVERGCPICGLADHSRVHALATFDAARLDAFAFSSRKLPEYMHHQLMICDDCELLYSSPVPSNESLHAAYQAAAFASGEESLHASRTYADLLTALTIVDKESALDIGAGDGAFLSRLLEHGFSRVNGVEPSSAAIAAAPPEVRRMIRHGAFRREDFAEGSLSLITCFQTLEHLFDPLALVSAARVLLKPGGAALFVCHDRLALPSRLLRHRSPIFDIEHLQLFSPPSARQLMARAGFKQIRTQAIVNVFPLRYWLKLLPLPIALKSFALRTVNASGLGALPIRLRAGNFAIYGVAP